MGGRQGHWAEGNKEGDNQQMGQGGDQERDQEDTGPGKGLEGGERDGDDRMEEEHMS